MYDNTDNFEFGDDFLDMTPKALTMKEMIDKLDFIKTTWTEWKGRMESGRKYMQKTNIWTKDKKGQLSKIHKTLSKQKTNNLT